MLLGLRQKLVRMRSSQPKRIKALAVKFCIGSNHIKSLSLIALLIPGVVSLVPKESRLSAVVSGDVKVRSLDGFG